MPPRVFEETVLPHVDAAFNYARWLTRNDAEAEDVVQEACLRAMGFFSSVRDANTRAWLFTIVRKAWHGRASRKARAEENRVGAPRSHEQRDDTLDPEEHLLRQDTVMLVRAALEQLPVDFREVIVLREMEGLSYREIAGILGVPAGTVMSRLARARERLQAILELDAFKETRR